MMGIFKRAQRRKEKHKRQEEEKAAKKAMRPKTVRRVVKKGG